MDGVGERGWFDYAIDGRPLSSLVDAGSRIGALGWRMPGQELAHLDRLAARAEPDTPGGRVSLYVCPACGDLDCGVFAARIEQVGDDIVWSDFADEPNPDGPPRPISTLPPIRFGRAEYRRILRRRAGDLRRASGSPGG